MCDMPGTKKRLHEMAALFFLLNDLRPLSFSFLFCCLSLLTKPSPLLLLSRFSFTFETKADECYTVLTTSEVPGFYYIHLLHIAQGPKLF